MKITCPKKLSAALKVIDKNKSSLSTTAGLIGGGITVISAVKATPAALDLKHEAERKKEGALTPLELVKTCYKPYIGTAICGGLSAGLIIYGKKLDTNTIKSMGAAYALSNKTCEMLEAKIKELADDETLDAIKEEVAQNDIKNTNMTKPICPRKDEILIKEPWTGTIFSSTQGQVREAVGHLNLIMAKEDYATLDDFFSYLGEDCEGLVKYNLGFNDYTGPAEVSFSGGLSAQQIPICVIKWKNAPVRV